MRAVKYLLLAMFPVTLVLTAYAHEGLSLWLTPEFGRQSGPVLQWLAVYLLLVSVSQIPFTFLHGAGRPALPALLHLIELPIYAGLLYYCLMAWGIEGAAIAAVCRIAIDFVGQLWLCGSLLRFRALTYAKILLPVGGAVLVLLGFQASLPPLLKAGLVFSVLAAHAWIAWTRILEDQDKAAVMRMLRRSRAARPT
jgi:O-antigen/teichoic acid export membrane protein